MFSSASSLPEAGGPVCSVRNLETVLRVEAFHLSLICNLAGFLHKDFIIFSLLFLDVKSYAVKRALSFV